MDSLTSQCHLICAKQYWVIEVTCFTTWSPTAGRLSTSVHFSLLPSDCGTSCQSMPWLPTMSSDLSWPTRTSNQSPTILAFSLGKEKFNLSWIFIRTKNQSETTLNTLLLDLICSNFWCNFVFWDLVDFSLDLHVKNPQRGASNEYSHSLTKYVFVEKYENYHDFLVVKKVPYLELLNT